MLNRFKIIATTVLCAAASLTISFSAFAGFPEYQRSYYNDYFDVPSVMETTISALEANPTGSRFTNVGLTFNTKEESYCAQTMLMDLMSVPTNSSLRAVTAHDGDYVYGNGYDADGSANIGVTYYGRGRYAVFVGFADASDHTEEIRRLRFQFETMKQAAAAIGGETEEEKIRNCMEYVVNMIDTYDASTPETHTIYNAIVNRTGCCQAYEDSFFLLASLVGCRAGIINLDNHSLNFVKTDAGIRYIDCCWIDTKNRHLMEWYMFANQDYDAYLSNRDRGV